MRLKACDIRENLWLSNNHMQFFLSFGKYAREILHFCGFYLLDFSNDFYEH